jgi:uncharacterized PurR-regulated membrane protein YhhQ (DUF165 family)
VTSFAAAVVVSVLVQAAAHAENFQDIQEENEHFAGA